MAKDKKIFTEDLAAALRTPFESGNIGPIKTLEHDLATEQDSVPTLWIAMSKTDRIPAIVKLYFSLGNRK